MSEASRVLSPSTKLFYLFLQEIQDDVQNHGPVRDFFLSSAAALTQACDEVAATSGLDSIQTLSTEIENRWHVVSSVICEKRQNLDSTEKQLRTYNISREPLEDLLDHAEAALASQSNPSADVERARVNLNTIKVCCLPFVG